MLWFLDRDWLRAFLQPVTYLGVATLVFLAVVLAFQIEHDRQSAVAEATRGARNLAHTFELAVSRALRSADHTLLLLRRTYRADPDNVDLADWIADPDLKNDLTFNFAIVGADGYVTHSTVGPRLVGLDRSDTPHFLAHATGSDDRLVISAPQVLRSTGQPAIFLSRRLTTPDGRFSGVLLASFNIVELAESARNLALGREGLLSLVGLDGIIRLRIIGGEIKWGDIGRHVPDAPVVRAAAEAGSGSLWASLPPQIDPTRRLVAYRVLDGLPLIALVGVSEAEVYAHSSTHARKYWTVAIVVTLAILVAIIAGAARERRLMAATASLQRRNLEFDAALDNMPHGLAMHDAQRRLRVCNKAYAAMYGLTPEQAAGSVYGELIEVMIRNGTLFPSARKFVDRRLTEKKAYRNDIQLTDGRVIVVNHQPMKDGGWVAVHEDVTLQKRTEAEILHLAHYDALTDLANRVLFRRRVDEALAALKRDGTTFNILLLDLDDFKAINDSLGHAAGDRLVKEIAGRLKAGVGTGDMVARLGGDEFAVLQTTGADQRGDAVALAGRVLQRIGEPYDLDGRRAIVAASIGIAVAPGDGEEADLLLQNADLALYKAKAAGRNTFRFFEPQMSAEARERFDLEIELRHAIAREAFELNYQPVFDAQTRTPCVVEALVRWPHPERGDIRPAAFVPLAESTGLIVPLGEWILRTACRQAALWPAPVRLAVNLSPVQFRKGDIVGTVAAALADAGLPAERLELEITETVLLERDEANFAKLHQLKALGASIVLDDFGTGYSSLSYLQTFPFDKIKIDQTFVAAMTTRADAAIIVSAITGLARSLNIVTTAEGVETEEQLALLRAIGCHQVQGFLLGRPGPASALGLAAAAASPQALAS